MTGHCNKKNISDQNEQLKCMDMAVKTSKMKQYVLKCWKSKSSQLLRLVTAADVLNSNTNSSESQSVLDQPLDGLNEAI